jgi:hypothetical protein
MTSLDELLLPFVVYGVYVVLTSALALVGSFVVGALHESRSRRKSQARAAASHVARRVAAAVTTRLDDADLRISYGSNTLARVGCDVDREATIAWTVLDISLSPDQQITMLAWAEAEIHGFLTSSCNDLVDRGWRNERPGRWHLLAYDGPAWESNLDYAATVTLRGPVVPDQAAQILARLREHMAELSPSQDQDDWVDLKLALCAETRWQAVMQAVLLTSELGYPIENVDVLPV